MGLTLKPVEYDNFGNVSARHYNVTGSGTYVTGGIPFTAQMAGLFRIIGIIEAGLQDTSTMNKVDLLWLGKAAGLAKLFLGPTEMTNGASLAQVVGGMTIIGN